MSYTGLVVQPTVPVAQNLPTFVPTFNPNSWFAPYPAFVMQPQIAHDVYMRTLNQENQENAIVTFDSSLEKTIPTKNKIKFIVKSKQDDQASLTAKSIAQRIEQISPFQQLVQVAETKLANRSIKQQRKERKKYTPWNIEELTKIEGLRLTKSVLRTKMKNFIVDLNGKLYPTERLSMDFPGRTLKQVKTKIQHLNKLSENDQFSAE